MKLVFCRFPNYLSIGQKGDGSLRIKLLEDPSECPTWSKGIYIPCNLWKNSRSNKIRNFSSIPLSLYLNIERNLHNYFVHTSKIKLKHFSAFWAIFRVKLFNSPKCSRPGSKKILGCKTSKYIVTNE